MSIFRVGQKVVCVDDSGSVALKRGDIYVVTSLVSRYCLPSIGIDVCEPRTGSNIWFARRFRPIVERKTDISIFTKMLTPEGVDA
jgi:hypothetical protein